MNKKNLFKLYKYCINFYCHKYHKDIYLADNEWLKVFSSKKYYNQLSKKLEKKDIFLSSTDYVDDCFFLSINYSVNRFKRILKLLQDNNIFHEFNIATRIIQFPVSLSFNKTTATANFNVLINEKELLQSIKNDNTEYLYNMARIVLKQHDYHLAYFYYGRFLKAYIQYMQNVPATYAAINIAYSDLFSLKLNYKQYKLDNDILSKTFNDLFMQILSDKFPMSKFILPSISTIITNFAENLNIYFVRDINQQCINNIYNYIHKNYIIQPLTPYSMFFTMSSMTKLYDLLNFNNEQKKILDDFLIKVKSNLLLMKL